MLTKGILYGKICLELRERKIMSIFTVFLICMSLVAVSSTITCFCMAIRINNKADNIQIEEDLYKRVQDMQKFMQTDMFKYIMNL